MLGTEDEPHNRSHGGSHRWSDEIEPGNGRLVVGADGRAPAHGPQRGPYRFWQERKPLEVDAVAGRGDHMIGGNVRTAARNLQPYLPVEHLGRYNRLASPHGKLALHPRPEPGGPGRPQRGARPVHPGLLRQAPEQLRMVGVEPRGPTRAEPGLGLPEPFEQRPVGVQGLPVPADHVSAGQDQNGGAVLVQQRRGLKS